MVWVCCVPNCKINSKCKGMSLFMFPKNREKDWLRAVGLDITTDVSSLKVCSLHFTESDIYMAGSLRKLRKTAIPVINRCLDIEQIYIVEKEYAPEIEQHIVVNPTDAEPASKYEELKKLLMKEKRKHKSLKKRLLNYNAIAMDNQILRNEVTRLMAEVQELKKVIMCGKVNIGKPIKYIV